MVGHYLGTSMLIESVNIMRWYFPREEVYPVNDNPTHRIVVNQFGTCLVVLKLLVLMVPDRDTFGIITARSASQFPPIDFV